MQIYARHLADTAGQHTYSWGSQPGKYDDGVGLHVGWQVIGTVKVAEAVSGVTDGHEQEQGEPSQGVWRTGVGPVQTGWIHHCT